MGSPSSTAATSTVRKSPSRSAGTPPESAAASVATCASTSGGTVMAAILSGVVEGGEDPGGGLVRRQFGRTHRRLRGADRLAHPGNLEPGEQPVPHQCPGPLDQLITALAVEPAAIGQPAAVPLDVLPDAVEVDVVQAAARDDRRLPLVLPT